MATTRKAPAKKATKKAAPAKKSSTAKKAPAKAATPRKAAAAAKKSSARPAAARMTAEEFGAPLHVDDLGTVAPAVAAANAQHAEWARVGMTGDVIPSDEDDDEGDSDG